MDTSLSVSIPSQVQSAAQSPALLVYAFTKTSKLNVLVEKGAHGLRGPRGALVMAICEGELAALVSLLPTRSCRSLQTSTDVLSFDAVVETLGEAATLLPVRYPCTLPSERSLRELMRARGSEYLKHLSQLADCAQMCIRVPARALPSVLRVLNLPALPLDEENPLLESLAPAALQSSSAGLTLRRAHLRRVSDAAKKLCTHFSSLVKRYLVEYQIPSYARSQQPVLAVQFLITREHIDAFRRIFMALTRNERTNFRLSGPCLPHSFAPCLPLLSSP